MQHPALQDVSLQEFLSAPQTNLTSDPSQLTALSMLNLLFKAGWGYLPSPNLFASSVPFPSPPGEGDFLPTLPSKNSTPPCKHCSLRAPE